MGEEMPETQNSRPSWMRFINHEGPSGEQEFEALQKWNLKKQAMGASAVGGGGHIHQTPRKMKHRGQKINGVRID